MYNPLVGKKKNKEKGEQANSARHTCKEKKENIAHKQQRGARYITYLADEIHQLV